MSYLLGKSNQIRLYAVVIHIHLIRENFPPIISLFVSLAFILSHSISLNEILLIISTANS